MYCISHSFQLINLEDSNTCSILDIVLIVLQGISQGPCVLRAVPFACAMRDTCHVLLGN